MHQTSQSSSAPRLTSDAGGRRLRGALVKFAGKWARTGRRGNARIVARFGHRGRRKATLRVGRPEHRVTRAFVRVRKPPAVPARR